MPRVVNGKVYIIPGGDQTRGHGTTDGRANLCADEVAAFLDSVPMREE